MTMKHHRLRITWSVAWGLVAVLFVVLWVRSYRSYNEIHPCPNLALDWWFGSITIYTPGESAYFNQYHAKVPCWLSVVVSIALVSASWLPRRFSLRMLLAVTALVAVVLGLIVGAVRVLY